MKKLNFLKLMLMLSVFALSTNLAYSQTFNNTYVTPKRITNHNTIVTGSDDPDTYVVAGTVSELNDTTKTDIQVTKFSKDGEVLWSRTYDITDQDRCYHINNAKEGYIITGSVWDINRFQSLYLLKIRLDGSVAYEKIYDDDNSIASFVEVNQGLSVIETSTQGFAVVGFGMQNNFSGYDQEIKQGFFVQTDAQLNPLVGKHALLDSAMAEHVLEVPGTGFFITGAMDEFIRGQNRILAVMVDYDGQLLWQKKFSIVGLMESGAHTVYDPSTRHLYLLSNMETHANFAITKIDLQGNIKSILNFEQRPPALPIFGFDLKLSPNDTANLIVTGYFKNEIRYPNPTSSPRSENTLFATEFNKNTGAYAWKKTYPVGALDYVSSDFSSTGGLFAIIPSLFNQPYIYTPAIAALTPAKDLAMVTYRSQRYGKTNNYNLTLVQADATNGNAPCNGDLVFPVPATANPIYYNAINVRRIEELSSLDQTATISDPFRLDMKGCQEFACGTPTMQVSANGCTFQFTGGLSSGTATSWLWNFGSGSTSTLQNPTHAFTVNGGYVNVCLTVTSKTIYGENCTTTTCQQVYVGCSGNNTRQSVPFQSVTFPVPSTGKTNIELNLLQAEIVEITVHSLLNAQLLSTIYKTNKLNAGAHQLTWNPSANIPSGIYLVKVKAGNATQMHKVLLQR